MSAKRIFVTIALLFVVPNIGHSDVMFKSKTTMGQMLGIGSTQTLSTTYIKGDASRSETATTFKSDLLKMGDGGMATENVEITRLDKGLVWRLDNKNKTYSEVSVSSIKQIYGNDEGEYPYEMDEPAEDESDDYDWTMDVSFSDDTEKVNGFLCKKATIRAVGVNKEDPSDSMFMTTTIWKSEDVPNFDEVNAFYKEYSEKTGSEVEAMAFFTDDNLFSFGGGTPGNLDEVKSMKGVTIKTEIVSQKSNLESGGEDDETDQMSSMLKGLLGKKSKKNKKSDNGRVTVLSVTAEITEIEASTIDKGLFEVPEGYTKTR